MLTIFEELVSVAICSRSNLRSTGLYALPSFAPPLALEKDIQEERHKKLGWHIQ